MTPQPAPDRRAELLKDLQTALLAVRLQDLRQAARLWGWTLRGTAKADLVEQMVGYLGDAGRMAAAFATLPAPAQDALVWLSVMGGSGNLAKPVQSVLRLVGGHKMTEAEAGLVVADLQTRGLLFLDYYRGYRVPPLFQEWLPRLAAPALAYGGPVQPLPAVGPETLSKHTDHLLAAIEADRPSPRPPAPPPGASSPSRSPWKGTLPTAGFILPRAGLLQDSTLAHWGYASTEDANRARFLVELLISGGLCQVAGAPEVRGFAKRLETILQAITAWQETSPAARQQDLQNWWLQPQQSGPVTIVVGGPSVAPGAKPKQTTLGRSLALCWHELDLALGRTSQYVLQHTAFWGDAHEQLEKDVSTVRAWLLKLVKSLRPDTWFDFDALLELIYHTRRNLLSSEQSAVIWLWYRDQAALDAAKMDLKTWTQTYGALVEAWFTGPAQWLGLVQVALDRGRLAAFRLPAAIEEKESAPLPADTVQYVTGDVIQVRNLWQAGQLRPLIRRVAVETARDRALTTYRLDAATFRQTLRDGLDTAQIGRSFADAGFPLPARLENTLRQWQANVGRHQIYDNLAAIEFADDLTLDELLAATSLGHANVYAATPRCLVVLQPEIIPGLLDELRRKGYTPQVIP